MKKNIVVLLLIMIICSFSFVSQVKADNIFGNDEAVEKFDYEEDDENSNTSDEVVEEDESSSAIFDDDNDKKSGHSIGLVLIEIVCGLIGLVMVFLAFKTYDS